MTDVGDPALCTQLHRALDAIASGRAAVWCTPERLTRFHDLIDNPRPAPPMPPAGTPEWVERQADLHLRIKLLQAMLSHDRSVQ